MRSPSLPLAAAALVLLSWRVAPAGAARWIPLGPTGGVVVGLAQRGGTLLALSSNAGPYVSQDGGGRWSPTAAGPEGTNTSSLSHISGDGTLFVADADAELWRSRDGGASWRSLRAAAAAAGAPPAVFDLDTAAADPGEVLAVFGGQPFRSHDGGDTWEALSGLSDPWLSQLRFDPKSGARLLANTSRGMRWSDDAGSTWHDSNLRQQAIAVVVEQGFRGRAYALIYTGDPRLPAGIVYVSLDHGRTFTRRAALFAVNRLAIDPTIDGGLYAVSFLGQVWRSTNAARSFAPRAKLVRFPVLGFVVDASGAAYAAVAPGPLGRSILRSHDHGATWVPRTSGLSAADVLALAPSPDGERWWAGLGSTGGSIWSASHFGVWTLDGAAWSTRGLRQLSVRDLDPHPVLTDEVVAATLGGGIARTIDGGRSWSTASPTGVFVTAVDRDPTEPRHVLAAADRGVAVSHDGGAHWSRLGAVEAGVRLRFARDGGAFYASLSPGEFFSIENVDALARFTTDGSSKTNLLAVAGRIQAILEPADSAQGLWVTSTTYDGTVFPGAVDHSTDGGLHWQRSTLPGAAPAVALAAAPGAHGAVLVGSAGAVYSSTDGGQTWSALGSGLPPGAWVTALALGADGRWRAATLGAGVFVLTE